MPVKTGQQTLIYENDVHISAFASVVGKKENDGPLGGQFDKYYEDELLGQESYEKAESKLQQLSSTTAIQKSGIKNTDIEYVFAGDLLNQCIGSNYGLRDLMIPFIGLYGACSTMALSMIMASFMVEAGAAKHTMAVTSSHFCSSERQFRFPLEYGGVRPQSAQWTVTGSGAVIFSDSNGKEKINAVTVGKIMDLGVTDMNNMGAAMAPAAADTLKTFFDDTHTSPDDYDAIFTGDLGYTGSNLLHELLDKDGISLRNHNDCGLMIFDREKQDVHSGGSGCGCSASVLCSEILSKMDKKELKNILFCATGALMSPTSSMQGESIPGIAHLLNIISCS